MSRIKLFFVTIATLLILSACSDTSENLKTYKNVEIVSVDAYSCIISGRLSGEEYNLKVTGFENCRSLKLLEKGSVVDIKIGDNFQVKEIDIGSSSQEESKKE